MDWSSWRRHFESNARRPLPSFDEVPDLPDALRRELLRSLSIFQRGETGEGRIAHQIDRAELPGIDDDYRAALKLFVAEEGRHARVLGDMVRALGGRTAERPVWTERLFERSRRLVGVRHKLVVLLSAEVIAVGFYGMIAERLEPGSFRAALLEIVGDERRHFEFHAAFFRAQRQAGFPFRPLWWSVATAAASVVLFDHRRTLAALGVARSYAARRLWALIVDADLRSAPELKAPGVAAAAALPAARW